MNQDTSHDEESHANERIHTVTDCPRCGTDHGEQTFRRLVRPVRAGAGVYEWWWPCATTGEPVLAELSHEGEI